MTNNRVRIAGSTLSCRLSVQTIGILLANVIMEITKKRRASTGASISLLPKLRLKIGDGQHTTPALGRKGSYLTLGASPLPQHTTRRGVTTVCRAYEDCFYGEKAPLPTEYLR